MIIGKRNGKQRQLVLRGNETELGGRKREQFREKMNGGKRGRESEPMKERERDK